MAFACVFLGFSSMTDLRSCPASVGELQVQAPQCQLHSLFGIAIGKLRQTVLVCLADRVE